VRGGRGAEDRHAEVLHTSWGKPYDIRQTTTAYHVHQRAAYSTKCGVEGSLYFDDDVLTAIQMTRKPQ
jgi:hypothetical protein